MSIYKDDLFKQFLTHFELHYSGANLEAQRTKFIDQIHRCLERHRSQFMKVATKVCIIDYTQQLLSAQINDFTMFHT